MKIEGALFRGVLAATVAGCASMILGCLNQRHLVGEGSPADASAAPDAGPGGGGGAPADGSDARGDGAPTPDASSPTTPPPAAPPPASPAPATTVGLGDEVSQGWPIAIPPEEVARRLSQFILQQAPTDALTVAIVAAAPRTNQDVGQLADGLLLEAGSAAGRHSFYRWWLRLDALTQVSRDSTLFPLFTDGVRQALIDQTLAFTEDVTWRPVGGDLWTLLTEPTAFVSAATAPWFPGVVPPTGADAIRVMLDGARFAGILTQPAVVAMDDYPTRAAPSRRGADLRKRFLCEYVPAPPNPGVTPTSISPGLSLRQTIEATTKPPECGGCHQLLDDPGFAFGHFDAVGSYQDAEGDLPIDTRGSLELTANVSPSVFAGPGDLAKLLGALPDVSACFAEKWLAFATEPTSNPDLPLTSATNLAADSDYVVKRATIGGRLNLRGTIRAVTETHTFLDP